METIQLSQSTWKFALEQAVSVLQNGGMVVYPTETLYGLAVDATNATAVEKLLVFKRRPVGKAVSVLVADAAMAEEYVAKGAEISQALRTLVPGPVTIVGKDLGKVDSRLISEKGTLGIRISSHPFAAELAKAYGKPLTATSANDAGAARPYTIAIMDTHLSDRQRSLIDLVIDAGELPKREPSTVVDFTSEVQTIHRAGSDLQRVHIPYLSKDEDATRAYGAQVFESFKHVLKEKPLVILLSGEMGTGKTRFTQGFAAAMGVLRPLTSPSYTLVKEYEGADGVRLVHADCWRAGEATAAEIGLLDGLQPGCVTIIEWPAPVQATFEALGDAIVLHHYALRTAENGHEIVLL